MGRGVQILQQMAEAAQDKLNQWHNEQPALGAELKAMTREAIKDVRGTFHQVMFDQPEHMSEPGTPLNPTPQMVTDDLDSRGVDSRTDRIKAPDLEMDR